MKADYFIFQWTLAIALDETIKPQQIRPRSNKFIWSTAQMGAFAKYGCTTKIVNSAPPLAVVALSKVCRALYEEVSLTHLFYNINQFEFRSFYGIVYLVALTTPRMKALRSVTCEWISLPKQVSQSFRTSERMNDY